MASISGLDRKLLREWFQILRNTLIAVIVGSGILITVKCGIFETVPYIKRTHLVLSSKAMDRLFGESLLEKLVLEGEILPPTHPESVRVRRISKVQGHDAFQRGLKKKDVMVVDGHDVREILSGLNWACGGGKLERNWEEWFQHRRKKGQERGSQPATTHVDGWNWEVLVVNESAQGPYCLPRGKIVMSTSCFEYLRSDEGITTVIGHEEMEADYVGMLLIASAGYDPRMAPTVYKKLDEFREEFELTGKQRAEFLALAKIMEEALTIYRDGRAERGAEGP